MKFLLCIDNSMYEASLEKLKLYQVLADERAEDHGMVRVIDESGEDYLFEKTRFMDLRLDAAVMQSLAERAA